MENKNTELENYINSFISPTAKKLIDAINEFIADSSRVDYRFEDLDEQVIRRHIDILENQIKILQDYEDKRRLQKDDKSAS